jgi:hypothetical protein
MAKVQQVARKGLAQHVSKKNANAVARKAAREAARAGRAAKRKAAWTLAGQRRLEREAQARSEGLIGPALLARARSLKVLGPT